jgi:hypothetical protein
MTDLDPKGLAAAWEAWRSRHGGKLGPGPAFVEAIRAYLDHCADAGKMVQPPGYEHYTQEMVDAIRTTTSKPASRNKEEP